MADTLNLIIILVGTFVLQIISVALGVIIAMQWESRVRKMMKENEIDFTPKKLKVKRISKWQKIKKWLESFYRRTT